MGSTSLRKTRATYLVRFDDVCPTMNLQVWDQVEAILVQHGVAPILAVVPDNRDPGLQVSPADPRFWDHVRAWQARGWTIGLHGFQHVYPTRDAGLLRINPRSEFAGLPYDEQFEKLRSATEIFRKESVVPQVWIAPAHSFDDHTLRALAELGINRISDGFSPLPYRDANELVWVPQQLWQFRRMPFGVWTVCYHINRWTDSDLARFRADVARFRGSISDFPSVTDEFAHRRFTIRDFAYAGMHRLALTLKRRLTRRI